MKTTTLIDELRQMQADAEAESGVWCPRGGVSTSALAICRRTGSKVLFQPVAGKHGPHEGRKAIICRGSERVTLTQRWHGGPESGEWWWTL